LHHYELQNFFLCIHDIIPAILTLPRPPKASAYYLFEFWKTLGELTDYGRYQGWCINLWTWIVYELHRNTQEYCIKISWRTWLHFSCHSTYPPLNRYQ